MNRKENAGRGGDKSSKPRIIQASVIGYEVRGEQIVYVIRVTTSKSFYFCYKTYRDMHTYHEKILKLYPDLRWVIKFPAKEWFWQSPSAEQLKTRVEKFNNFLTKVTTDKKYAHDPDVRFFVGKDLKELEDAVHYYRKECYVLRSRKNRKESEKDELKVMQDKLKEVNQMYLETKSVFRDRARRNSRKVKSWFKKKKEEHDLLNRSSSESSSSDGEAELMNEKKSPAEVD